MKNCVIFLSFLAVLVNLCFALENCGDANSGELTKISVTGCADLDQRCILRRNTNVTLIMEFKTKLAAEKVQSLVYGVVLGVPIPFALPNPDGCVDSGLQCPLVAQQTYTYQSTLPVEKKYPKVTVDVKWELQNEKNENILCVLIPSKIQ